MNFTTLIDLLVIRNKTPTEVQSSMRELYLKYGKGLVGKGIEMLKVRERELARDIAIDLMLVTLDKAIVRRQMKVDKRGENGKRQFVKLFHLNHLSYVQIGQIIPL